MRRGSTCRDLRPRAARPRPKRDRLPPWRSARPGCDWPHPGGRPPDRLRRSIVPCGQTKARPTFSARLHDAVDAGGRITLVNRALQEALRAEAAIRRLRVTFGNCHIFDVWNFNDRPALIIGMEG